MVFDNLSRAFPEKSTQEIKKIAKKAYKNLTDITLETIKSQTTPLHEIYRRCKVMNPEIVAEPDVPSRDPRLHGGELCLGLGLPRP